MRKTGKGWVALLAALALMLSLPLAQAAECVEPAPGAAPEDWQGDAEVTWADDAGDTGLTVAYGDSPVGEIAPWEDEAPVEVSEDEAALPEGEPEEDSPETAPAVETGYVAVAAGVSVYADAARAQRIGAFPEGAPVYAEAIEDGGALLRIRFDTAQSRDWGEEIPTGYVPAGEVLALTGAEADALRETLSRDARVRVLDGVAIPCVCFDTSNDAASGKGVEGLGVATRTQAEIQAFVDAHPAYRNQVNLYSTAPTEKPYAAGKLSPVNQQSALNLLNQIRFIAGLGSDVRLLPGQESAMGAAALVLRLYSAQYRAQYGRELLTHYPGRASAIADAAYDDLYLQGYAGAGRSNIAMGYTVTNSLLAYMSDVDGSNLKTVGHRRWILNPAMGRTAFGANGRFSAMYAHDRSAAGGETRVAWPAQNMPRQYFSDADPWSLSYGRPLAADRISVRLVRARDGRTWNFSSAKAEGFFAVDNSDYGLKGCVIFLPDDLGGIAAGDAFNVTVTDAAAGETTRYTVRFFDLDLRAGDPLDLVENVTAVKTASGNAIQWSPVRGAEGYYVCRRPNGASDFQIVADVSGIAWKDTGVSAARDYSYQVYAHTASRTSRSAISVEPRPVPPDAVRLNVSGTVQLYKNATLKLTASFSPADSTAKLTWRSSKSKIAAVDADGVVKPKRTGSTVITVVTDNGKRASVKVKIVNPPRARQVILSASGTVVLNVGETLQLDGVVKPDQAEQKLTWRSSRKKVAAVSGSGLVTARRRGTATITARSASGKKARVKVKVVDPRIPDSVALDHRGTVTLRVGETLKLGATVAPATAITRLSWSSSRQKVAAVDSTGTVTARKSGTATITVRTENGKKARVKVKVIR